MPTRTQGLSIVEQYAARRQRAREDWAFCMLIAMVPFCIFVWGPAFLQIPAWFAFGAVGAWGVRRQFKINRCPACDAGRMGYSISIVGFARRSYVPDPNYCDKCGVELVPTGQRDR